MENEELRMENDGESKVRITLGHEPNAELQEQNAAHFEWNGGRRPLFNRFFDRKRGPLILHFPFSILH